MTHCGYVAIVGRPNVGKSTLLNTLLGQKLSITCRKPQTTRHQILGIDTQNDTQIIYVDTPGMHDDAHNAMNRYLNKAAKAVIHDVDAIVFVIEAFGLKSADRLVAEQLLKCEMPVILVINKIDQLKDKTALLGLISQCEADFGFREIIPLSARREKGTDRLADILRPLMPAGDYIFDEDDLTDRPMRFIAAEVVREKLTRLLGDELPYDLTVVVDDYKEEPEKPLTSIWATIFVERATQKAMIIGKGGQKLKQVGSEARVDLERWVGHRVFLQLWVKVKSGWSDNEAALSQLGYE